MKEELQTKLVEILGSIQTAAGKAGDFAMGQLPDIALSYLLYGRVVSTLFVVLGLVIVGATLVGLRAYWRVCDYEERNENFPLVATLSAIPLFIGFLVTAGNLNPALLVWFAPKVWLLKEIATLVR